MRKQKINSFILYTGNNAESKRKKILKQITNPYKYICMYKYHSLVVDVKNNLIVSYIVNL